MRRFHLQSPGFSLTCALGLGLSLTLGGCADDEIIGDSAGASAGDSAGVETGGDTDADMDEDPIPLNWVPARGISIIEIEANQGTRVPIVGEGGAWVGPAERNLRLLSKRDTLLRVHWTVEPGWETHDVRARLTITGTGSDEPIVRQQTISVTGNSTPTALTRTFWFGLVADEGETADGARIQVELFEADIDQNTSLSEAVAVAPADGAQLIGFETMPMELKIMLVPIHYTGGGNDRRPDLSEANVQTFIDALYESLPVQEISYQVRAEVNYAQQMNNLGSLLPIMASVKQNDGTGANFYYHALIDIGCPVVGCGSSGVAGIAQLTGDTKANSLNRVAATVFHPSTSGDLSNSAGTFVHEVGHNQGLSHVECPGQAAAGPDPSYPYENGKIGQWGFGIRNFTLHNPTASHDYMTYCGKAWTSDWTFLKTYKRIRTLTSWDYEGAPADGGDAMMMGEELLVGALYPDGTEEWFTLAGGIDMQEIMPGEGVGFEVDGAVVEQPAVVRTMSDGETQWVVAPMPAGTAIEQVARVTHVRGGEVRRTLPATDVRVTRLGATDFQP